MVPDGAAGRTGEKHSDSPGGEREPNAPTRQSARLDVLIPHFQDVEGLALSLASIAEQTWTGDMRVVLVDDGSPAEDVAAVEALADRSGLDVILARNPENRGRPYTRNHLLDMVEAEYVAWLDAGDVWYPEKLSRQFEHLSRLRYEGVDTDRVWITCHYDWKWDNQSARRKQQEVDVRQMRELMLGLRLRAYLWTLLGSARAFRAAGRFDERLPRLQDLDYFMQFLRVGGNLSAPPGREALCRYHKSDIGRNAREIRDCHALIMAKYLPQLRPYGPAFLKTIRYNAERLSARYAANNGARLLAGYYHGRAVAAHPRRAVGAMRRRLLAPSEE